MRVEKVLNDAWDRAEAKATESPAWTSEQARREASDRAHRARIVAADPDVQITDTARQILIYAADSAEHLGTTRLAIPQRMTAEKLSITEKSVRCGLVSLTRAGFLIQVERGRRRGPDAHAPARAAVFELASVPSYLSRVPRLVRPSDGVSTPFADSALRPDALTSTPRTEGESAMVEIVVKCEASAVEEVFAALGGRHEVVAPPMPHLAAVPDPGERESAS